MQAPQGALTACSRPPCPSLLADLHRLLECSRLVPLHRLFASLSGCVLRRFRRRLPSSVSSSPSSASRHARSCPRPRPPLFRLAHGRCRANHARSPRVESRVAGPRRRVCTEAVSPQSVRTPPGPAHWAQSARVWCGYDTHLDHIHALELLDDAQFRPRAWRRTIVLDSHPLLSRERSLRCA